MKKFIYIVIALCALTSVPAGAQGIYDVFQMNDGEKLDMSDFRFGIVPSKGLFCSVSKQLIPLDRERNKDEQIIDIPDTTAFPVEEFVVLPRMVVFKSGKVVIYLPEGAKRLRSFGIDTDDFHIRYATDSTIYMLVNDKVFEMNPLKGAPTLRCHYVGHHILEYKVCKEGAYVVTEDELLQQADGILTLLVGLPETITAADISEHGILIGTSSALFRYEDIGTLEVIDNLPIREIFSDGDYLYIITQDSSIYRLQRVQQIANE